MPVRYNHVIFSLFATLSRFIMEKKFQQPDYLFTPPTRGRAHRCACAVETL